VRSDIRVLLCRRSSLHSRAETWIASLAMTISQASAAFGQNRLLKNRDPFNP